jgi:eukaryotic-like serine/threonine-protein kinase
MPSSPDETPTLLAPEALHLPELPGYALHELVGTGGTGRVYRATRHETKEVVAIKVLRWTASPETTLRRRFFQEAEAIARLSHPNLIKIQQVGETHDVPWFAMDYIAGGTLGARLKNGPLPAARAAQIACEIADGIAHAHAGGILHRDLKPGNILLTPRGDVRVADFGVARMLGHDSTLTVPGEVIGTPGYMAPEQAEGQPASPIDERTDVYGIGAILYHLLTGRPPFSGISLEAVLLWMRERDPISPRRLDPSIPSALETICLKCMEKNPALRYPSAAAVRDDLRCFLEDRRISARPPSRFALARRWCARRPAVAALTCALILALGLGVLGIASQWRRASANARAEYTERLHAEANAAQARLNAYAADIYAASHAINTAEDYGLAEMLLARQTPTALDATDHRGFEWHYFTNHLRTEASATLTGHPYIVRASVFSPDGTWFATGGHYVVGYYDRDPTLFIWDAQSLKLRHSFGKGLGHINHLDVSADGTRLAVSTGHDKTFVYDTQSWEQLGPPIIGTSATFIRPTSHQLLLRGPKEPFTGEPRYGDTVMIVDHTTRRVVSSLPFRSDRPRLSPDGKWFAYAEGDFTLVVADARSHATIHRFTTPETLVAHSFSNQSRYLAATTYGDPVLIDLHDAQPRLITLPGHRMITWSAVFSPDDSELVTTGSDRTVRRWKVGTWQNTMISRGHRDEAWTCAFHPTDGRLISGGKDHNVLVWAPPAPAPPENPRHESSFPFAWAADGHRLLLHAVSPKTGALESRIWDERTRSVGPALDGRYFAFATDGHAVVRIARRDGTLALVTRSLSDASEKQQALEVPPDIPPTRVENEVLSASGQRLFFRYAARHLGLWNTTTGQLVRDFPCYPNQRVISALSPDGVWVATSSHYTAYIRLFHVPSGADYRLEGHLGGLNGLTFSADSRLLASASLDATVRLWEVGTQQPIHTLRGHYQDTDAVSFSPDGKTLASLGHYESLRFWNVATGRCLGDIPLPRALLQLHFSPNGRALVIAESRPTNDGESRPGPFRMLRSTP